MQVKVVAVESLTPAGIRPPNRLTRNESIHRLRHFCPRQHNTCFNLHHNRLLPNLFQFISHQSFLHSTLHNQTQIAYSNTERKDARYEAVELNQCIQLIAPTTCTLLNTWILKAYLRHVSAPVYQLQGAQNARFKTNCQ